MSTTFSQMGALPVAHPAAKPGVGSDGPASAPPAPELNRGGQGVVTLGKWGDTPCAIKTVNMTHSAAAGVEIATALRLNASPHAHIVAAYGYSRPTADTPGKLFLELAHFDLLHACYLARTLRFAEVHPVREWMLQLAHSLAHLHSIGIAHRDVKPENVLLKRMERDAFERMAQEELGRHAPSLSNRRARTDSSPPLHSEHHHNDSREHTSASMASAAAGGGQGGSESMDRESSLQTADRATGVSVNDLPVPRSMLSCTNTASISPMHRSPKAPSVSEESRRSRLSIVAQAAPIPEERDQCSLPAINQSPTVSRGSSALTPAHSRDDRDRSLSGHLSQARTTVVGTQGRTPGHGGRVHSTASANGTVEDDDTNTLFRHAEGPVPRLGSPPGMAAASPAAARSSPQTAAAAGQHSDDTPQRNFTTQGRLQGSSTELHKPTVTGHASSPVKLPPVLFGWSQVDTDLTAAQRTYAKRFKGPNSSKPETAGVGLVPLLEQCSTGQRSATLALRSLTAKLCDFGCAIHSAGPGQVPVGKSGKGSTSYCAPEVSIVYLQGKNRPSFDAFWPDSDAVFAQMYAGYDSCMADVWSFGVTLFVIASGRLPFRVASVDSGTFRAFVRTTQPHVVGDELLAPRTVHWTAEAAGPAWTWPRGFSPALKHLLRGCLAVRPAERFSMEQVKAHPWFGDPQWQPPQASPTGGGYQ